MPPLVLFAGAWALGLILAHHWLVPNGVEPGALLIVGSVPLAAVGLWWRDRQIRLAGLCALAMIGGAVRYQADVPDWQDPAFVAHYNDRGWVTVEGVVAAYPDVRDTSANLRLAADKIEIDGQSYAVRGLVLVRVPRLPEQRYGDRLRVAGRLETPPEIDTFSYRDYLARQSIYAYMNWPRVERLARGEGSPIKAALFEVKDRARAAIARLVPEPEAGLLQGIVLGVRGGIARELYDQFSTTGTSHIIVISGANVSLVVLVLSRLFTRLVGRRAAYWLVVGGIVAYVMLVGGEAAVARAGLMGGLFATALYLGRRATAYVSLCAAGLALTCVSPLALWDAGFQLSFAATLGLILFAPPLEKLAEQRLARLMPGERARQVTRVLGSLLIVTLAAQVLTLPLVLYHFGRLSLVAPLANVLILGVQPAIMAGGGAATIVALVPGLAPVAQVIFWIPWLGLAYTTAVVRWLAGWPLASLAVSPDRAGRLAAYYGLLLVVGWAVARGVPRRLAEHLRDQPQYRTTTILLAGPLVAVLLAWIAVWQQPDGRLHVAFLDVGEGDAILITTPLGQQILVDGGPSPTGLLAAVGREMPFWDRSIDLVVMTHADTDHLTGLVDVLRRYRVEGWIDGGEADGLPYAECRRLLERDGVARHVMDAGDTIDLGQGAVLQVLNPEAAPTSGGEADGNERSLVVRLTWQQASALLTADIGTETERRLLRSGQALDAQVLKVAHHGSDGSSGSEFLTAVGPRYAIISVGAGNRFGHPAPAVLERLASAGAAVVRTDQRGMVEFITDGRSWWLETER